ncbi:formimidoylglutamate deiminase [Pectobacterium cacticida]|uniref:Formimidoylglutamate deiminase n=1 Tax=Pectobacterium cacticida TaxID=69221 RepID=A0ABZ2G4E3_9GAMM
MTNKSLFARHAWLTQGWHQNVLIHWDERGMITQIVQDAPLPTGVEIAEWLIPGMPNLHSHAFQHVFAGLTEYRQHPSDSFWSWRKLMYAFAQQITPSQLYVIATHLYQEMLSAGYTSVCEFHYVHHQPNGHPYPNAIAMSEALLRAAQNSGIGMTLLPVLYQTSGFGNKPAEPHQRRFTHDAEAFLQTWRQLYPLCQAAGATLGIAPHSLRAVNPDDLRRVLSHIHQSDPLAPVHIHVAEQTKEVDDCLAWCGKRPVAWLLDNFAVDERWCLIHATHMDADEYRRAAASGAVIGLCPTTEANLGDGIFDFTRWQAHAGRWGIGSDSHIAVNAAEELLQLEYSQRLLRRERNVCCDEQQPDVASYLYRQALTGGAQASGRPIAGIQLHQQADFIELDANHPLLAGRKPESALAVHLFASSRRSAIRRVWTAGIERASTPCHSPQALTAVRQEILATLPQE